MWVRTGGAPSMAVTTNGGVSWTLHSPPAVHEAVPNLFSCVEDSVSGHDDCWGVDYSGVLATTDSGSTWAVELYTLFELFGISCPDASHCWAVDDISAIVESSDGGQTWIPQTPPNPSSTTYENIACADDSHCVAVGYGAVAATSDGGSTWTDETSGLPSGLGSLKLSGVACPSASDCYAAGSLSGSDYVVVSTDGGHTWSQVYSTASSQAFPQLSCPSTSVCWAALGGLVETTDSGSTWSAASTPSSSPDAFAVSCATTTACWALDYNYTGDVLTTTAVPGCSTTWCEQALPSAMDDGPNAISCPTATTCWVTGFSSSTSAGGNTSAVTTDAGSTWTTVAMPSDTNYISAVSCPTAADCFAAGWSNAAQGAGGLIAATQVTGPEGGPLSVGELIGANNGAEKCMSCTLGQLGLQRFVSDPVNTATGALSESYTDLNIPTYGPPLGFTRSYDSGLAQSQAAASTPGPLGYGWTDNWSMSLQLNTPATGQVTVDQENGAQVTFVPPAAGSCPTGMVGPGTTGTYCAPPRVMATLTYNSATSTYRFDRSPGYTFAFNSTGQLTSETDPSGNTTTVSYGSPSPGSGYCPATANTCNTITSASGRALVLAFDSSGQITKVTDPMGRAWTYTYCSGGTGCTTGDLISATDPLSHTTSYSYDATNTNSSLRHDLTAIVDPNEQSGGPDSGSDTTFTYDTTGRVTAVDEPGGRTTTFAYSGDNFDFIGGTTLETDPDGNQTLYSYIDGALVGEQQGYGTATPSTWTYQRDPSTLLADQVTDPDGHTTTISYDTDGNPVQVTDADDRVTSYSYNAFDERTCATDAMAADTCDTLSPPAAVTVGTTTITPPSTATPAHVTYSEYDSDGNLVWTTVSDYTPTSGSTPTSTSTSYRLYSGQSVTLSGTTISCDNTPPAADLACATINPDGTVTQIAYDSQGDITSQSVPDGNGTQIATTTHSYNTDGQQTATVDPLGNLTGANTAAYTTTTSYNNDGQTTSVSQGTTGTGLTERTTSYSYDADGNRTTVTPPSGHATTTTYDANDQAVTVTDADTNTTLTCYDGDGHVAQTVPPAGVAANTLTAASCPTSYPAGYDTRLAADATTYTYDPLGDRTQTTTPAPAGQTAPQTTYNTYDLAGHQTASAQPSTDTAINWGSVIVGDDYFWQADGVAAGRSWPVPTLPADSTHDVEGDSSWSNADGTWGYCTTAEPEYAAVSTVYGTYSDVFCQGQAAEAGTTIYYEIDDYGPYSSDGDDLDTTSGYSPDPNLPDQALTADAVGMLAYTPGTSTVYLTYSQAGMATPGPAGPVSPATDTHDPGGSETTYNYDPAGQLTSTTTAAGTSQAATTSYCYNPAGQQTATVAPDGNPTTITACATSSPWQTSSGYQTGYSYDSLGQQISVTRPATTVDTSGQTTTYGYDPAGQQTTQTPPDAVTTTTSYTPTGLPASVSYSNANPTVTYSYDADGNRTAMVDATGTTSYTYTNLDQTATVTNPASQTVTYTYEPDGQTATIGYPLPTGATWTSAPTATYSYDNADQLTNINDPNNTDLAVTNTADGQPDTITLAATGDTLTTSYDNTDTPQTITLADSTTTLASYTYTNAPAGQTATETDTPTAATTPTAYSYDPNGRLSGDTPGTSTAVNYNTDASGNLTTLPNGQTATYNDAEQLASSTDGTTTTNYNYDADGNQTTTTQATTNLTTATWNDNNQLTGYTTSAGSQTNTYNGDGQRTTSTNTPTGGTATTNTYLWDTTNPTPRLLEDDTNLYIYGPTGTPLEQIGLTTGTTTYLIADRIGSVRATLNSSGTVTATTSYDPWGNPTTSGGLTATTPIGYAGAYTDPTGLIYLINRYYNPTTGQLLSLDPLVDQTQQPYQYAQDNPTDNTDPTGQACWAALEFGLTSSSRQCWTSGYSNAIHHPTKVLTLGAAVTIGVVACVALCAELAATAVTYASYTAAVATTVFGCASVEAPDLE
jgi:RHS repeat-associated protein